MASKSALTHTTIGGTMTEDGFIPHRTFTFADGTQIEAPVAIEAPADVYDLPRVRRDAVGIPRWAFPGGSITLGAFEIT